MRTLAPEQQLRQLRRYGGRPARWGLPGFLGLLTAGLLLAAALRHSESLLVFGLFSGLFTWGIQDTLHQFIRATAALDQGAVHDGWVDIRFDDSGDSRAYEVQLPDAAGGSWRYFFVPMGWSVREGRFPARIHALPGETAPALAVTEAGVLVPQSAPRPGGFADAVPTAAQRRRDRRRARWLGSALLLVAAFLGGQAWLEHRNHTLMAQADAQAEAVVLDKTRRMGDPGGRYWIRYRFTTPDGRVHEQEWSLGRQRWQALRPAAALPVRYLSRDPAYNHPEGEWRNDPGAVLVYGGLAFFAGLSGLLMLGIPGRET